MILEAKNITFSYSKISHNKTSRVEEKKGLGTSASPNSRILYDGFNIAIQSNECVGISAPSGFGKTTLCKLLAGYEKPSKGEILLDGIPLADYKGYCPVQMIWQHPEFSVNPLKKMKTVLEEGDNISEEIISALGIKNDWLERYPSELSGGELQRFCIARALGDRTKFIIADEITTMLDLVSQAEIWNFLLQETKRRDIGILAVSHHPALLDRICTRQISLFS